MAKKPCCPLLFLLLNLVPLLLVPSGAETFSRSKFPLPPHFVFGSGTSAYQSEGAALEDGRTPSIWDTFAHSGQFLVSYYMHDPRSVLWKFKKKCVQVQHYSLMSQPPDFIEVQRCCAWSHTIAVEQRVIVIFSLMKMSNSWWKPAWRLTDSPSPDGRGPVNPKGVEYYNHLINELIKHGIQPHVTLMHIDFPQALEDEYGGWLSRQMVKDFTAYANVCFREFGDRVLHWTTLNEANIFTIGGYDSGEIPPERCSPPFGVGNCSKGDSSTEPYVACHHILLAHASAPRLYRKMYQGKQHGFIGINVYAYWLVPYTNATEDVIATQRATDFLVGWFVEPLVFGDYPDIMKKNAGKRLPAFTKVESELVKGSIDFLGLNHYNTFSIKDQSRSLKMDHRDFNADMAVELIDEQGGGTPLTPPIEFPVAPSGLVELLEYFKQFYGNPPIYVHENGQRMCRNATLNDMPRVKYLQGFIGGLLDAIRNGSNARGYFYWSFMDLFELLDGYETSYGLYAVDLKDLKRYPKLSAHWYSNFLKGKSMSPDGAIEVEKSISSLSQSHFSE
ncbi:hypothetical protein RHGRI_035581 [Rhododendron griersonianum]|uniref:Beta-glucosidase 11 n=1 Tax=Rhododendron griersonianum TaxID=479676 RepID=A0AAV6HJM9_9ERIC|nr:hypothetical protein RHGRI_035581 [Rhododendron griersonianum]